METQAQYTGHGNNTGGLQAHSIGDGYPWIVVGGNAPGGFTNWKVQHAFDEKLNVNHVFRDCENAHLLAEGLASGRFYARRGWAYFNNTHGSAI